MILEVEKCNIKLIVYDLFYNAGPKAGAKVFQRALNRYFNNQIGLIEDGIIGEETIKYLNKISDLELFIKFL